MAVPPARTTAVDDTIAGLVAERIPDGATIQTGIGAIPNAIMSALREHRDLGVHTELLSDGVVDLIERGVVNGVRKDLNRTKTVGTFALGTERLHDFLADNPAIELWPVRYVNNPAIIGRERDFVSINATLSVDFIGQCASETIDGQLLLVVRRSERLRTRRHELRGRTGLRRPALDDQLRAGAGSCPASLRATS